MVLAKVCMAFQMVSTFGSAWASLHDNSATLRLAAAAEEHGSSACSIATSEDAHVACKDITAEA